MQILQIMYLLTYIDPSIYNSSEFIEILAVPHLSKWTRTSPHEHVQVTICQV